MHRAYHSGQFRSAALSASHTVHELSRQESLPGQDFASTYACIIATAPRLFVRNLRSVSDSALSHKPLPNYTFLVTRERWAQVGITTQFLIVVRTLAEIFRLRHVHGANFSVAAAMPYVGGALIAACFCWAAVTSYFLRRYRLSAWIALVTIVILLAFKIIVIGW